MFQKIEGFILKTQDYGETHKIVTLLTREMGKFGAIARGAKKTRSRMAAITQPFIHGSFLVQSGKGLGTIQQGEVIHSYRKIREDIFLTAYASYIVEMTDKLTEQRKYYPGLLEELLETMSRMESGQDAEVLTNMYEWKMYEVAGFSPVVKHCVRCGNPQPYAAFSIQEGGLLCSRCQHHDIHAIPISEKIAKLLQIFSMVHIAQVGEISIKENNKKIIRKIMDEYYEQYGGFHLKSKRFLQQMDKLKE